MFCHNLIRLRCCSNIMRYRPQIVFTTMYQKHNPQCPLGQSPPKKPMASAAGSVVGSGPSGSVTKRAEKSGLCRMGFIPNEWFTFFQVKTGVSGFYVFMLTLGNYCVSKEIYVMEHEYYLGLSIFVVVYFLTTRFGPAIGKELDKQVDAVVEDWERGRKLETAAHENTIKECRLAQTRAEGQKLLMDAKKENIAMQLEAAYRERSMLVYKLVKGRMEYHAKRYYAEARIHQKWMIEWILKSVMQSITADFQKQAMNQAIKDIEAVANRA